jgi:hypothetical protein
MARCGRLVFVELFAWMQLRTSAGNSLRFPEIAVAISTAGVGVSVSRGQMRYSLTADSMEPAPIARRPSLVNSLFEFRFSMEAADQSRSPAYDQMVRYKIQAE